MILSWPKNGLSLTRWLLLWEVWIKSISWTFHNSLGVSYVHLYDWTSLIIFLSLCMYLYVHLNMFVCMSYLLRGGREYQHSTGVLVIIYDDKKANEITEYQWLVHHLLLLWSEGCAWLACITEVCKGCYLKFCPSAQTHTNTWQSVALHSH